MLVEGRILAMIFQKSFGREFDRACKRGRVWCQGGGRKGKGNREKRGKCSGHLGRAVELGFLRGTEKEGHGGG